MDNNNINKLIDDLYSIKMTEAEKTTMQENLLDFTRSHSVPSPYAPFAIAIHRSLSIALLALLVIGSVSKPASASALPGELLYPVKIIHEEIAAVTKNTPEKKINHEIKRTEERISEAAQLAEKENLDTQKQAQIAQSIKKHTDKAKEEIQVVKEENPLKALELNTHLEDTLKTSAQALKEVVDSNQEPKPTAEEEVQEAQEEPVETTENQQEEDIPSENELEQEESTEEELPTEINELDISLDPVTEETLIEEVEEIEEPTEVQEPHLLLDILEADLKEVEAVSQEVKDEIIEQQKTDETPDEKELVEEETPEEEPNGEELVDEEHIQTLEEIVSLENQIELINVEIESYYSDEDPAPNQSEEVIDLRNLIAESILEKDYQTALENIEALIEIKNLQLSDLLAEPTVEGTELTEEETTSEEDILDEELPNKDQEVEPDDEEVIEE